MVVFVFVDEVDFDEMEPVDLVWNSSVLHANRNTRLSESTPDSSLRARRMSGTCVCIYCFSPEIQECRYTKQ